MPFVSPHLLQFVGTVLNPLQVDVTVAGSGDPLQTVDIVFINLHAEHSRILLNVMPFSVRLQGFLHGLVFNPYLQLGVDHQVVDDTLKIEIIENTKM